MEIFIQNWATELLDVDFISLKRTCRAVYNTCGAVESHRTYTRLSRIFAARGYESKLSCLIRDNVILGGTDCYIQPMCVLAPLDTKLSGYEDFGTGEIEAKSYDIISYDVPGHTISKHIRSKIMHPYIKYRFGNNGFGVHYFDYVVLVEDPAIYINNMKGMKKRAMIKNGKVRLGSAPMQFLVEFDPQCDADYARFIQIICDNIDYIDSIICYEAFSATIPEGVRRDVWHIMHYLTGKDIERIDGEDLELLRNIAKS